MGCRAIHQLVAGFRQGDAISNAASMMRDVFRSWGVRSDIYCIRDFVEKECRSDLGELSDLENTVAPDDVAILHLSIGCLANKIFPRLKCRKVIVYHNITPSKYFRVTSPGTALVLDEGRSDLVALAGVADLNVADSAYNALELVAAGYRDPKVLPLPIDLGMFNPEIVSPHAVSANSDGRINILFVGRIAPNKKVEDILTVMYYLTKVEPLVRFIHCGSFGAAEAYLTMLEARVRALRLEDVYFNGLVSQAYLNACYKTAHAFLCLSEHEGFCAPLVEAMLYHVPVFALATSAVPETLGGAGVLFEPPADFPVIAETIAKVIHDNTLRDAIVAKQDARVDQIRNRDLNAELKALLSPLLA